jgi:hypothetical protein
MTETGPAVADPNEPRAARRELWPRRFMTLVVPRGLAEGNSALGDLGGIPEVRSRW